MPLGGTEREVRLAAPVDDAFERARSALESAGKVTEEDAASLFLRGTARYGLQKIRLKLDVVPAGDGSTVRIRAQGDDVWGKGAKRVVQRLADAIEV